MALCNHFSKFKALNLALLQVDYSKKEKKIKIFQKYVPYSPYPCLSMSLTLSGSVN